MDTGGGGGRRGREGESECRKEGGSDRSMDGWMKKRRVGGSVGVCVLAAPAHAQACLN